MGVRLMFGNLFLVLFLLSGFLLRLTFFHALGPVDWLQSEQVIVKVVADDFGNGIVIKEISQNDHAEVFPWQQSQQCVETVDSPVVPPKRMTTIRSDYPPHGIASRA